MASYTMELREIIEHYTQDKPFIPHRERIENGRTKLFDFDYPLFDPDYKKGFETRFIRNFYMREIGFETEGLFKFQLETWMLINMPYFNKLFESELINYDPLINNDVRSSHEMKKDKTQKDDRLTTSHSDAESESTSKSSSSADSTGSSDTDSSSHKTSSTDSTEDNFNRTLDAETPDNRLNLTTNDGEGVIEYASNIQEHNENNQGTEDTTTDTTNSASTTTKDSTDAKASGNVTANTTDDTTTNDTFGSDVNELEEFIQHKVGKIGVQLYPDMIMKHREAFLRVEQEIFREMQQLFMLVY